MATSLTDDRLLRFAHWMLSILLVGAVVMGLIVATVAAVLASGQTALAQTLAERGIAAADSTAMIVLMVMLVIAVALGFFFLLHLKRIVDSAAEGDPFVPINAQRLRAMGWLILAMQLLMLVMPLIIWFDSFPDRPVIIKGENGLSIGMLVLALLLFVLARVFRRGTEMRDELEGTI